MELQTSVKTAIAIIVKIAVNTSILSVFVIMAPSYLVQNTHTHTHTHIYIYIYIYIYIFMSFRNLKKILKSHV